jgi:hypothetical protein
MRALLIYLLIMHLQFMNTLKKTSFMQQALTTFRSRVEEEGVGRGKGGVVVVVREKGDVGEGVFEEEREV